MGGSKLVAVWGVVDVLEATRLAVRRHRSGVGEKLLGSVLGGGQD